MADLELTLQQEASLLRAERDAAVKLLESKVLIEWAAAPPGHLEKYGYYIRDAYAGPTMLDVVRMKAGIF